MGDLRRAATSHLLTRESTPRLPFWGIAAGPSVTVRAPVRATDRRRMPRPDGGSGGPGRGSGSPVTGLRVRWPEYPFPRRFVFLISSPVKAAGAGWGCASVVAVSVTGPPWPAGPRHPLARGHRSPLRGVPGSPVPLVALPTREPGYERGYGLHARLRGPVSDRGDSLSPWTSRRSGPEPPWDPAPVQGRGPVRGLPGGEHRLLQERRRRKSEASPPAPRSVPEPAWEEPDDESVQCLLGLRGWS